MLTFLRILAAIFLLIAAIAGVYDGTRSLAADRLVMASLLELWTNVAPSLLATAQGAVRRSLDPRVWDQGVATLLQLPAWSVFAGLGLMLAYAGRRRRRVNVFAN